MQNKKVKKKSWKKVGHQDVQSIENNGYKDPRHEKEREIAPALANISGFNERDMFQGA
jgi:hypothetical protein